ncbi:class I SAM-dependent DNA methyltransferase [Aliikangiella coralliicola]|uniref:Class I SAM-dependent methyltransferase n=1 Tax=Aliikangiella coralliicola TaxID=2592383 RepID=A0A545UJE6_9GAMM|nr:class I SAM-dependent methyltransferase [Aliikangiella coralliicola]TQV89587.1 class I SAM-dependent methyltransferase [Aliikangiella coralliicola]
MDHSPKFWDRVAAKYAKRPIADEASYQKKLETTRQHLQPDMELLELGCGTGSTAIIHSPYVKHIHAIDISSKMLAIAEEKVTTKSIDNITFEHSTIDEYIGNNQSGIAKKWDAVLALSVLHLVSNKEEVIASVYKMLKPGGLFVTSTACLGDTMKFFKVIAPIGKFFGFMPLVKIFTAKELEDCFMAAGFEIEHRWRPGEGKALFLIAKKAG